MKRLLVLFLTLIMLLVCTPTTFVYADTGQSQNYSIYKTSKIQDDLNGLNINGTSFNINNYNKDTTKDIELIYMLEVGYNTKDYNLYLYVYNPTNINIDVNSSSNKVEYANEFSKDSNPMNYTKTSLKFINRQGNLLKFSCTFNFNLQDNNRHYYISSFELGYNNIEVKDCKVAKQYIYSGTADNLSCSIQELEVLELKPESTYYRTDSSSAGKYHQNQLTSLYFSIPNNILEKYGDLTYIKCSWYEYKTSPIVVLEDTDYYNFFKNKVGQQLLPAEYDKTWIYEYGFGTHIKDFIITDGGGSYSKYGEYYDNRFSLPNNRSISGLGSANDYSILKNDENSYLKGIFYLFNTNGLPYENYTLSADTLKDYVYNTYKENYKCTHNDGSTCGVDVGKNEKICSHLLNGADTGRTAGYQEYIYSVSDLLNIETYKDTHNFWDTVKDWGFWSALTKQTPQDKGFSCNAIESFNSESIDTANYYINNTEEFKKFANDSIKNNETPYLFRIALTDYYSAPIYGYHNSWRTDDHIGYVATETIFFNYDILYLGFSNSEVEIGMPKFTIPVVSNPQDIFTDVTPPKTFENNDWIKDLIKWAIIVIVAILLIILFISNPGLVLNIILFPVKLVWWIIKKIIGIFKKE